MFSHYWDELAAERQNILAIHNIVQVFRFKANFVINKLPDLMYVTQKIF